MNIKDVYFGKNVFFLMFMRKRSLCSHQAFNLTSRHSQNFKEFFAHTWLEIWGNVNLLKEEIDGGVCVCCWGGGLF